MTMRKIYVIFATLLISAVSFAQSITLLHLNDTHSHMDPEKSGKHAGKGGVIEQAAYIDSVRCADGKRNVLLLHAGDFSQGTSYFPILKGNLEIDVINAFGYDAVCLGNHEFDNGPVELARRLKNCKAAVVCANYDFTGSPVDPYVDPYVIVKKAGRKIGIIGLLTDVSSVVDVGIASTMKYLNPVEVVNRYAELLKDEKDCDLVITTGGTGPTQDDLTKEVICQVMDDVLVEDPHSLDRIIKHFERRQRPMSENNLKQAMMPSRAVVFDNNNGTAPGFALECEGKIVICLPGPPNELNPMFEESASLLNSAHGLYKNTKIIDSHKEIYNEYFLDKKQGKLYLYAEEDFTYPLKEGEENNLKLEYSVKLDNAKDGDVVGEIKVFYEKDLLKTIKLVTMNKIDKLIESETLEICEVLWVEKFNS